VLDAAGRPRVPEVVQFRRGAGDAEERLLVDSDDQQLGVHSTAVGHHVRRDGAAGRRQLVGGQSVEQVRGVAASQFQLPGRRQVDHAGALHHRPALARHRLEPTTTRTDSGSAVPGISF